MVLRKLLGAKYGRCVVQKGAHFDPKSGAVMAKRTEFLQHYACALRLEEEEKARKKTIVFLLFIFFSFKFLRI
jgi:hypothetical protein